MKCELQQKNLLLFMRRIQGISSNPSFSSNFLLEATANGDIILLASGNFGVKYSFRSNVISCGKISIPSKTFFQSIREIPSDNIILETLGDNIAEIKTTNAKCRINFNNENIEPFYELENIKIKFDIPFTILKDMLNKTSYIASRENRRPILQGIKIHVTSNKVAFISTDGKRISIAWHIFDYEITSEEHECVVPIKCIEELEKHLLSTYFDKVCISIEDTHISFQMQSMVLSTRLLEGKYPDITSIIPDFTNMNKISNINKDSLINAIKIASVFISEKFQIMKFIINSGKIEIICTSPGIGEGSASIDISFNANEKITIGFNPISLLEIIRKCKNDSINMLFKSPFEVCSIDDPDTNSITLIMPMRLLD